MSDPVIKRALVYASDKTGFVIILQEFERLAH